MTRPVSGLPVVLLAGMLSTGQLWDGVVGALDPGLTIIRVRIDLDDNVTTMARSVLSLAPPRFALAGHSLGGIVALAIMRLAPERITRLALINCSGRGPSAEQLEAWSTLADGVRDGHFARLLGDLAAANLGPAADNDENTRSWIADAQAVGPYGFMRQLAAQRTRPDSLPGLVNIAVPALVVSGELDGVCPPALQVELAAGIPHAVHRILPGAGHMSPVDSAPDLARMLNEFLRPDDRHCASFENLCFSRPITAGG